MYSSTKIIDLGSCAFRQPFASSHCKYLHGYKLTSKFWFSCNTVDENNWVVDFGSLKPLKSMLAQMFDHTVVVWDKDPALQTFKELNNKSLIDIRIMTDGVGIEKDIALFLQKPSSHAAFARPVDAGQDGDGGRFVHDLLLAFCCAAHRAA